MLVLCGCWNVWIDKVCWYCVAVGMCGLINSLLNSRANYVYVPMQYNSLWSADYFYVPINYNFVVSTHHRYCNYIYCLNYLLFSPFTAPHCLLFRTVCVCCVVNIDSGTAQTAYW